MARRSREETRRLVLDEGARWLLAEGLRGSVDIRLQDVCDRLEQRTGIRITSGSVYERIWRDQRDFQLDVMAEVLREYRVAEIVEALDVAAGAVGGHVRVRGRKGR